MILMTVVFLWLGNMTMGQENCASLQKTYDDSQSLADDCIFIAENSCTSEKQKVKNANQHLTECRISDCANNEDLLSDIESELSDAEYNLQQCEINARGECAALEFTALQNRQQLDNCETAWAEQSWWPTWENSEPLATDEWWTDTWWTDRGSSANDCPDLSWWVLRKNWLWCECPLAGGIAQTPIEWKCVPCNTEWVCCGISLNTSIPFIGNCIEDDSANKGVGETNVTGETAFPVLMWSLTKILVSVILIISFVLIIVGGIMIATGNPAEGKKMIIKVVIGIALLGASGVILRLINPNFFG